MSFAKSVPKELKWIECEHGIGGKNSTVLYIPEQDLLQDALEKNKKTTYFKLTLPNMGNELKVAILGIHDSRAVSTACSYCDSHVQADGA